MAETSGGGRAGPVVEVEFGIRDPSHPFVGVSQREACTFELANMIPRPGGRFAEFFEVRDADPDRILALAAEHEAAEVSLLAEYDRGGLFEFLVSGNCPAYRLAELGALPRIVEGVEGAGRIVVDIPPQYDAASVVEAFLHDYPEAEIVTKREKETVTPQFARGTFQQVVREHLTERQREVIETAFEAGYYEWPRECTGQEVAGELGITSATFSEHIHAAERKLLVVLFGGSGAERSVGV